MERYRSGHNEAVLKTVCPKGRVGSNPTLSVFYGEVPKLAEGAVESALKGVEQDKLDDIMQLIVAQKEY